MQNVDICNMENLYVFDIFTSLFRPLYTVIAFRAHCAGLFYQCEIKLQNTIFVIKLVKKRKQITIKNIWDGC